MLLLNMGIKHTWAADHVTLCMTFTYFLQINETFHAPMLYLVLYEQVEPVGFSSSSKKGKTNVTENSCKLNTIRVSKIRFSQQWKLRIFYSKKGFRMKWSKFGSSSSLGQILFSAMTQVWHCVKSKRRESMVQISHLKMSAQSVHIKVFFKLYFQKQIKCFKKSSF